MYSGLLRVLTVHPAHLVDLTEMFSLRKHLWSLGYVLSYCAGIAQ